MKYNCPRFQVGIIITMGSHESYSFEKTKQTIRSQPHHEVKRVHFENEDDGEDNVIEPEETADPVDPAVPLLNQDIVKEGTKNNNAKINIETDTNDIDQSIVNVHNVTCEDTLNGNEWIGTTDTNRLVNENLANGESIMDDNRNKNAPVPLDVQSVIKESTKPQNMKTKMTLDELMISLKFISTSGFIERIGKACERIPENLNGTHHALVEIRGRERYPNNNRRNGHRENRHSRGQSELETLYEEVAPSGSTPGVHEAKPRVSSERRSSGDYDNVFEEQSENNRIDSQADSACDITINEAEDRKLEKDLRERQGKLWLYKYNYLNFNKKVQIQSQKSIGYYNSSYSLDGYVGHPLPTIFNHRGCISQSFESYLNKSGYTVQNNPRSNHNGFLSHTPISPNAHNSSKLTSTSDEGYHSNLDSTDPHSDDIRNETFQNSTFNFTDNRLSAPDTGGCLFTTFKPQDNSNQQRLTDHSTETSFNRNNHGSINQSRLTANDSDRCPLATLKEFKFQNQSENKLLNKGNAQEQLVYQRDNRTRSTDTILSVKRESDAKIDIPKAKDSDKSKKKRTGWKINFKLCCGCGFKKIFLLACLQVNFAPSIPSLSLISHGLTWL